MSKDKNNTKNNNTKNETRKNWLALKLKFNSIHIQLEAVQEICIIGLEEGSDRDTIYEAVQQNFSRVHKDFDAYVKLENTILKDEKQSKTYKPLITSMDDAIRTDLLNAQIAVSEMLCTAEIDESKHKNDPF